MCSILEFKLFYQRHLCLFEWGEKWASQTNDDWVFTKQHVGRQWRSREVRSRAWRPGGPRGPVLPDPEKWQFSFIVERHKTTHVLSWRSLLTWTLGLPSKRRWNFDSEEQREPSKMTPPGSNNTCLPHSVLVPPNRENWEERWCFTERILWRRLKIL